MTKKFCDLGPIVPLPSRAEYSLAVAPFTHHEYSGGGCHCSLYLPCSPFPCHMLRVNRWASWLQKHPEQHLAKYALKGISGGFRIGFNYSSSLRRAPCVNLLSAFQNPQVVSQYLEEEKEQGRIIGPLEPVVARKVHTTDTSPFGVIPKRYSPGKWRLILGLSNPTGSSVNDAIHPELCSLSYISVDDVARVVALLGRGTMLGKTDIKSAYRIIPAHPADRLLLGMEWQGNIFVDTRLPFGLRSVPLIFTTIADTLEWVVKQQGVQYLYHYLDDFITCGPPDTSECQQNMHKLLECCSQLGIPIAQDKTEDLQLASHS